MTLDQTVTLGLLLNLAVLFGTVFNSWQHQATKNKILALELRITRNFVSNKVCEERRGIVQNGDCGDA